MIFQFFDSFSLPYTFINFLFADRLAYKSIITFISTSNAIG